MLIFTYEVGNYRSCGSGSVVVYLKGSTRVQKDLRKKVEFVDGPGSEEKFSFVGSIHQWR